MTLAPASGSTVTRSLSFPRRTFFDTCSSTFARLGLERLARAEPTLRRPERATTLIPHAAGHDTATGRPRRTSAERRTREATWTVTAVSPGSPGLGGSSGGGLPAPAPGSAGPQSGSRPPGMTSFMVQPSQLAGSPIVATQMPSTVGVAAARCGAAHVACDSRRTVDCWSTVGHDRPHPQLGYVDGVPSGAGPHARRRAGSRALAAIASARARDRGLHAAVPTVKSPGRAGLPVATSTATRAGGCPYAPAALDRGRAGRSRARAADRARRSGRIRGRREVACPQGGDAFAGALG